MSGFGDEHDAKTIGDFWEWLETADASENAPGPTLLGDVDIEETVQTWIKERRKKREAAYRAGGAHDR